MRFAGLSVDMDSVASHLDGYGFARPPDDGAAYRTALPRALDLFDECGVRATFFLIAEEAARHPDAVADIVRRGHEVASHSLSHPLPFTDLDPAGWDREIAGSKRLLEELTGRPVVGFRAPSWDLSPRLFDALVAAGYRYDASTYPSLLLPLLRWSVRRRSATGRTRTGSRLWAGVFGPTVPHLRRVGGRVLAEVPMCTAPWTRLPYYHTLRFVAPRPAVALVGALARRRHAPITYQFHAVDFLDVEKDRLDPRIARHPGMQMRLDAKMRLARRALQELRDRAVVPLAEIVEHCFGAALDARHPETPEPVEATR
jgi:peptidoglycan/xylan/chitin deacetylase (PgdA/CDA1 family)